MFGSLGMPELLLILVIALIVFGPKKLPEVGRSLGKAMREFKRTTEDIKGKFEEQINAEEFKDIKSGFDDIKTEIKSVVEMPIPAQSETEATGMGAAPAETKDLAKDASVAPDATPAPPAPSDPSKPASQHGEG